MMKVYAMLEQDDTWTVYDQTDAAIKGGFSYEESALDWCDKNGFDYN